MVSQSIYQLFDRARKLPGGEVSIIQSTSAISECADDTQDIFVSLFEHLVAAITELLGKPKFNDGMAHRKFPGWFECVFLAYWDHAGVKYLVLRNAGTQWTISLGVRAGY